MGVPRLIGSEIYRQSRYGGKHPLAIPRVSLLIDLLRALGWLPPEQYLESAPASPEQLARFHDPAYVAAVRECERTQRATEEHRLRYGLGVNGNPVFGEIFRRPATACGATLMAAALLRDGGIIYSPAGGTHHGKRDRAAGFCYFNDPVLGLLAFRDQGLERVAYVDFDAHHCDGVEEALGADPAILLISIHEAGRWPRTGATSDPACHTYNLPVPAGLHDGEFAALLSGLVRPLLARFRPQALVLQCGADALADDPMSDLALSNRAYWHTVAELKDLAPRLLVLGGGGYNPWAVARCWAGIWAVLNGFEVPPRLPRAAEDVLRAVQWSHSRGRHPPETWFTTLADESRPGTIRPAILEAARRLSHVPL